MKFSIKKSTDLNPLDSMHDERIISGLAHYQIRPLTDYDAKEEGRVARTFQGLTRIPRLNQEKFDNWRKTENRELNHEENDEILLVPCSLGMKCNWCSF